MEHDQRVCPRCGEPAGDYSFCEACRSQLDSLSGIVTAAQAPREVRIEQARAAASNGDSDRITSEASATAVQVDRDPGPAENLIADANAKAQAPPEVARFEEVMTIAPPVVDAAPAAEVELPTRDTPREIDWARLRREVARLEQAMTMATGAAAAPAAPVEADNKLDAAHVSEPGYVAADLLREAFWFEQASAFKSKADPEATQHQAPQAPEPEPAPAPYTVDWAPAKQRHGIATMCILALIGLAAVLTGRGIRRLIGA
jgi:hypothetical protein